MKERRLRESLRITQKKSVMSYNITTRYITFVFLMRVCVCVCVCVA